MMELWEEDDQSVREVLDRLLEPTRTIRETVAVRVGQRLRVVEAKEDATSVGRDGRIDTEVVLLPSFDDEGALLTRQNLAGRTVAGRILASESYRRCAGCGRVVGLTDSRPFPLPGSSAEHRLCHRCGKRAAFRAMVHMLSFAVLHPFLDEGPQGG